MLSPNAITRVFTRTMLAKSRCPTASLTYPSGERLANLQNRDSGLPPQKTQRFCLRTLVGDDRDVTTSWVDGQAGSGDQTLRFVDHATPVELITPTVDDQRLRGDRRQADKIE